MVVNAAFRCNLAQGATQLTEMKVRLESIVCHVWKPNGCLLHKLSTTVTSTTRLGDLPSRRICRGQLVFCATCLWSQASYRKRRSIRLLIRPM
jgi:hypothetical protein